MKWQMELRNDCCQREDREDLEAAKSQYEDFSVNL